MKNNKYFTKMVLPLLIEMVAKKEIIDFYKGYILFAADNFAGSEF